MPEKCRKSKGLTNLGLRNLIWGLASSVYCHISERTDLRWFERSQIGPDSCGIYNGSEKTDYGGLGSPGWGPTSQVYCHRLESTYLHGFDKSGIGPDFSTVLP